jgi:hypothetical protein
MEIVRVSEKLTAFREHYPPREYAILQSFDEDVVGATSRVVGHCRIVDVASGAVLAEAHGTRALREPVPGAQGHRDTRDPDRAMTQALGRVLGLMGYADATGVEGDTDEPDETGVTDAAPPPVPRAVSNHPAKGKVAQLASARAKLKREPEPAGEMIDTGGLKAVLNGLDADVRGKVRAGLSAAGLPTQIPERLAPEVFDQIEAFVDKEIDTLLGAS